MSYDQIELYFIEGGKQKVSTVKFETPAAKAISIEDFRIVSTSDKVNIIFHTMDKMRRLQNTIDYFTFCQKNEQWYCKALIFGVYFHLSRDM